MLRDIFKTAGEFESYGVVSMIIFVVFFGLLILHTISIRRSDAERFSRMPLDELSKESDEIQEIK